MNQKGLTVRFIAIVLIIIVGIGGYTFFHNTRNWKIYRNEKYGFEVAVNEEWKNLKVIDLAEPTIKDAHYLYFQVPTADKTWRDFKEGRSPISEKDVVTGYYSVIGITAWSKIKWQELQKDEYSRVHNRYLGENNRYVFSYQRSQSGPDDLRLVDFKIKEVIGSFRIIKNL